MIVTCVHVYVKSEHVNDFIQATTPNHHASVNESGNLRFDLLQDQNDPTHFLLYEAYQSQQEAAAHKDTDHYKTWRATVAEWMAQPREGVKYNLLLPQEF